MGASKKELIKITENAKEIEHLKKAIREIQKEIKEIRNELKGSRKESVETQRNISNRRLAIYLATASILGGVMAEIFGSLIPLIV